MLHIHFVRDEHALALVFNIISFESPLYLFGSDLFRDPADT